MFNDVVDFMDRFLVPRSPVPILLPPDAFVARIAYMTEELTEIMRAYTRGDLAEVADGLIDLEYYLLGTAAGMGLPWAELWNAVHTANMAKVQKATDRSPHDVVKPPGWAAPDLRAILAAHGKAG